MKTAFQTFLGVLAAIAVWTAYVEYSARVAVREFDQANRAAVAKAQRERQMQQWRQDQRRAAAERRANRVTLICAATAQHCVCHAEKTGVITPISESQCDAVRRGANRIFIDGPM